MLLLLVCSAPSILAFWNTWAMVFTQYPSDLNRMLKKEYNPSTPILHAEKELEKLIDLLNVMQRVSGRARNRTQVFGLPLL